MQNENGGYLGPLLIISLLVWSVFGSPSRTFANLFWPEAPAPWEKVDAFFYPDSSILSVVQTKRDIGSLENCRDWVEDMAARERQAREIARDQDWAGSDYECGVGKIENYGDLTVYRLTLE